jgi:hypothetical protein
MKLVVQDGSSLSRTQLQTVAASLPEALSKHIGVVLVCASWESSLRVSYSPKERVLTLFMPAHEPEPLPTADVVREFLIALAVVAERGDLPARISKSVRAQAVQATSGVLASLTPLLVPVTPNESFQRTAFGGR